MTFVDTNVLVYSMATRAPLRERARVALANAGSEAMLAVSRQVLREYLAVVTRQQNWGEALPLRVALADAEIFCRRFRVLDDGPAVWDELRELCRRFSFGGRQVHDANIVATMLAHGERRLLTFNDADFRRFAPPIEIVVP
jgi:predicted nucleic acid-binding protein